MTPRARRSHPRQRASLARPLKRILDDIEFENGFPQRARVASWSGDARAALLTPGWFTNGLAADVSTLELPALSPDASARDRQSLATALTTAGFGAHDAPIAASIPAREQEETDARRRRDEAYQAARATEEAEERRRAARPRVTRLPVITVRASDGTTTQHQSIELTIGRFTLRWIGAVLFVRGGYPYTEWTAFEGGDLDGTRVEVEDVELVISGPTPDEATPEHWARWLATIGDTLRWDAVGQVELDAAERAASEIMAAATELRAASALPRADLAWLQAQPWLSLATDGIAIRTSGPPAPHGHGHAPVRAHPVRPGPAGSRGPAGGGQPPRYA